ncbi:serine/threonine protein kinase [Acaryochloris marina MBIC11017]|uniref:non-specific serine/threonine protein kinase n=2 Tax=Acaryochloris marina TaxID=155978 RepID=B0C877_ACAM1|nr:protein kinase [Acaryochloris marina]ABW28897.1 serine/threonine protein kinase [Acaryochloris marina MBIC11017]
MSGQVIAYRYHVLKTLAQGSFGTTFLARDTYLPDYPKCVIKQLQPDSSDPKFLEIARRLFEQEASILGNLGNHPRIPKLLSYFESEQDFFLVQEFIDGISIAQELSPEKRWPEAKVKAFLIECLDILKYVHDLGVIHRDIKPDNLIRRLSDQAVFLLDFGAVKQISSGQNQATETTIAVGTPGYMPDEQIRGKPHISSDIYALGTIGIYGLTGVRPVEFERSEEDEILWQHQADVSTEMAEILRKMVRRDYRKRYQSVAEVLADLEQVPDVVGSKTMAAAKTEAMPDLLDAESAPAEPPSTIYQSPASVTTDHSTNQVTNQDTNIQAPPVQPEKGTAPIYETSGAKTKSRQLLKVLVPSTVLVGAGIGGFLLWGPKTLSQTAAQLSQLHGQAKYSECIDLGETAMTQQSKAVNQLLNPLSKCYLGQAKQLAEETKLGEAVQMVTKVSDQSTYHFQATQKLDDWSALILQEARQNYEIKGDLKLALAGIEQIPTTSVVKTKAQRESKQWQDKHSANEKKITAAKKALKEGREEDAIATAKQIKAPEYWKKIADQIQKDAKTAIANRPAPEPVWQPPAQTATRSAPPVYQPPVRSAPVYQPPVRSAPPPVYRPPARSAPPVYQPPAQPAPPPQKEVMNICPGPLCSE